MPWPSFFLNRDKSQLILQLSQKNEELKYLAMHDDLTGLYNIRFLYQDLNNRIKDTDHSFSVIFMDMDNFKKVVDAHGHLNGSQALKEVAATIRAVIQEPAYGVAYGVDEFVIILPDFDKQMAIETSRKTGPHDPNRLSGRKGPCRRTQGQLRYIHLPGRCQRSAEASGQSRCPDV